MDGGESTVGFADPFHSGVLGNGGCHASIAGQNRAPALPREPYRQTTHKLSSLSQRVFSPMVVEQLARMPPLVLRADQIRKPLALFGSGTAIEHRPGKPRNLAFDRFSSGRIVLSSLLGSAVRSVGSNGYLGVGDRLIE